MSGPRFFAALAVTMCELLVTGCASLSIRVEILNSAYWSSPQYVESVTLAKISDAEQSIRDGRFVTQREALKQDVRQALMALSKEKPPKPSIPAQDVDEVASNFGQTIDKEFEKARGRFRAAFAKVRDASRESSQTERETMMNEAKASFSRGADTLVLLVDRVSKGIRTVLKLRDEDPSPPAVEMLKTKGDDLAQGLIGNAGILDDPRAATVVYAPSEHWTGEFNKTLCFGSFGNTDCAVKMEGLGAFTLKGVRLDATKITQATFSVTREAIQAVAAVYGIPVPKPPQAAAGAGGQTGDSAPPPPAAEVDSPVKRQRDAGTAITQLRLARLAMFESIVAQLQALRGDDAARAQAIKTVKAVVDANRKQLDQSSSP